MITMGFKEMAEKDLDIFFNLEEFGEEIDINGTIYTGILDKNTKAIPFDEKEPRDGIYREADELCVKTADIGDGYEQGKTISVNYDTYTVLYSSEEAGMTIIGLQRHAAW